ncbi:phospholipase D family protein [Candidatus Chlamydia sanziniae]|uniref:Phospholipase D family protein n=2 Tax=Candidatus Chlamydia sanziniae TaxID=1806891 RepID=A0A1A9HVZ7_9CHLA|nr:phosphatidylserine/phosphatidylglycerophosphate/cardiolipin synthase family protein [Candidatus Chlamydia sanziniae]ANH79168.1 phospholipase D family protein [Candidatus Chlamydia sanziniae]
MGIFSSLLFEQIPACAKVLSFPSEEEHVAVLVHDNGLETFEYLLHCIDHANYYVELCPCMAGGRLLKEILDHLCRRMDIAPALCAYMLIQPTFINLEDQLILKKTQERYPQRFFYVFTGCPPSNSVLHPNVMEMHVKFCLIDGKYCIMGGSNFEDFMCTPGDIEPEIVDTSRLYVGGVQRPLAFRDQDVTFRSVTIGCQLRKEFYKYFKMWEYYAQHWWFINNPEHFADDCPGFTREQAHEMFCPEFDENKDIVFVDSARVKIVFGGPHEGTPNPVTEKYLTLIRNAQSSIQIANMYFIPKDELIEALIAASFSRHIQLDILTNGCHELSPLFTSIYAWGNRINYFALSYGSYYFLWQKFLCLKKQSNPNLAIYEFAVKETQLHKKCMIVDDAIFVIGSYNFGKKSDLFDYESILVIESPEVAQKAKKVFEKDKTLSRKVENAEILDWYFHPVHYTVGHLQRNLMPG